MCCFVILLLSNEMQMSVRRFSAIPHLRAIQSPFLKTSSNLNPLQKYKKQNWSKDRDISDAA